jgi:phage-related minor tail protein
MDFSADSDFSAAASPDQKSWLTKKAIPAVKKALPVVERVLPIVAPFVPVLQPVAAVVGVIRSK